MKLAAMLLTMISIVLAACSGPKTGTLKNLRNSEVQIEKKSIGEVNPDVVRKTYKEFIDEAPRNHPKYNAVLSRLADLEMVEGDKKISGDSQNGIVANGDLRASKKNDQNAQENYLKAIAFYEHLLDTNPDDPKADWTTYQLSRAYEQSGRLEQAAATMNQLVQKYPKSSYYFEALFRLGELEFTLLEFDKAESAYGRVIRFGKNSPYYERSLYKFGWSVLKQERYPEALDAFFTALRALPLKYDMYERLDLKDMNRLEQEMVNDIFRAINLALSYSGGIDAANRYLAKHKHESLEYEIYLRLGNYFAESARIKDSADAFGAFVARQPNHPLAPEFQIKRIEAYSRGGLMSPAIDARKEFVQFFGRDSQYFKRAKADERKLLMPQLKKMLIELSQYYHATAQQTKKEVDYNEAIRWYVEIAMTFPAEETTEPKFLLADLLYQIQRYFDAIKIYEQIAYEVPKHEKSADAGYSAILGYDKLIDLDKSKRAEWTNAQVKSALRFVAWFPSDKRTLPLQVKVAEQLFEMKKYDDVLALLGPIIDQPVSAETPILTPAYVVIGHIAFERKQYQAAIDSYRKALSLGRPSATLAQVINERIAAASYKRAELVGQQGNTNEAIQAFLQTAKISSNQDIRSQAEYDAAVGYMRMENWAKAAELLEQFRKQYPGHKLIPDITEKLAFCYEKSSRFDLAARETKQLVGYQTDRELKRRLLWSTAELYEKAQATSAALDVYKEYADSYPEPKIFAMEATAKVIEGVTSRRGDAEPLFRRQVSLYNAAGSERNDRMRYLAASASYHLAEMEMDKFRAATIGTPLKKSMKRKQELMKSTLAMFEAVANYGVAEYATAATFQVAQVYHNFSTALLTSEKPKGLAANELEEYNLMLEEQAYPFEEKAIEIYQVNAQRIKDGLYDEWVRKSMVALSELQPARYGKVEKYEARVDQLF